MNKIIWALIAAHLCLWGAVVPLRAEQFVFNPPDGLAFEETVSLKRSRSLGPMGEQSERSEQTMQVTVRKEPDGFRMDSTLSGVVFTRNGDVVQRPFLEAMVGTTTTYHLAADGKLTDISGIDTVIEKMTAELPDLPPAVKSLVNEEAMKKKNMAQYKARLGDYIGREFEIGDVWTSESRFTLPDGRAMDYLTVIRFKEKVPCGDAQCVQVEYLYDADPAQLKAFIADVYEELEPDAKAYIEGLSSADVTLSGRGKRLIDPQTMLIYDEEERRTVAMQMKINAQQTLPVTMTETRLHEFKY